MGVYFGWKRKIFHPAKLFFVPQGVVLLPGEGGFRRVSNFFLNLSLLNRYSIAICEAVMTDFAILGKVKNARFCKIFDRFCKIFLARCGYFCP